MPLHVSSTRAHHQKVKIALHSLWYHHTYKFCASSWLIIEKKIPRCTVKKTKKKKKIALKFPSKMSFGQRKDYLLESRNFDFSDNITPALNTCETSNNCRLIAV